MDNLLPVVLAAVAVTIAAAILLLIQGSGKKKKKSGHQKNRQSIIRDATKRLSQDPHSTAGLIPLADLYYREHNWEKAFPLYETLVDIAIAHTEINLSESALRYGICSVQLKNGDAALKGLAEARKLNPNSFEVNFYLGQAFYLKNDFEKAIPFFKKARALNPEVPDLYEKTGLAMYKAHQFKNALPYLKRALKSNPDSRELLFSMAEALNNTGSGERALKVFLHLRPDPEYGAKSCIAAGTIHANQKNFDKAINDFEIGLRHTSVDQKLKVLIRYNIGQCYLQKSQIDKALSMFRELQTISPNYKDVPLLINRYQELNQNKNLQTFLIGSQTDFISLCRRIVSVYYKGAHVKIIAIETQNDIVEIQTEIETTKWQDNVVFRFSRGTGSVGELYVRDFHSILRDLKSGRGIFISAGKFSEEARKYIEGRPVEIIEKSGLLRLLEKVGTLSVPML